MVIRRGSTHLPCASRVESSSTYFPLAFECFQANVANWIRPAARLPYAPAMPPRAIRLSKSRVMAGLQCHKRLWWAVHEPSAPELQPDEALQAQLDGGTQVGEVVRTYVPGGVLIDLPHNAHNKRIAATKAALQQRTPVIYEGSFRASAGSQGPTMRSKLTACVPVLHGLELGPSLPQRSHRRRAQGLHIAG